MHPVSVAAQRCRHPHVAIYGRSHYALHRPTSYFNLVHAHTKSCQQQVTGMAIIAHAATAWVLHDNLHVIP